MSAARPPVRSRIGGEVRAIARLGAPLIAFSLAPNLVSLATLAMLGRVGDAALAGVGAASAVYGVILALLFGLDTGVQAVASRSTGAGHQERLGQTLADAWAIGIPLAALLGLVLWFAGPVALAIVLPAKPAAAAGSAWLQFAAPSLVFFAVTVPINACWIGTGRPAIAFVITLLLVPVQILSALPFIFGFGPIPDEGAAGAAIAMTLTGLAGVGLQSLFAARVRPIAGFLRSRPTLVGVGEIAAIGWPISTQQSLLNFGLMAVFVIVAPLGQASVAIINVLLSVTGVPTATGTGLGIAAATLVGQALGRGERTEARAWGWRTLIVAVAITGPMGLALTIAPHALLGFFLRDPATLALAIWPARIVGLGVAVNAAAVTLGFAFRGSGATKIAAGVPFCTFWFILLPTMWWVGVHQHHGLLGIVSVQAGVTLIETIALAVFWTGSSWMRVSIPTAEDGPPPASSLRRVAILGGAGAGKSTLARRLGNALDVPVVHLDKVIFGPEWTRQPTSRVREQLATMLQGGAWVVEGSYGEVADMTLPNADLVVWIDQPTWLRLWRSWRKTRINRDRPRADRPDGCEEGFGWTYVRMVLEFGQWSERLERRLTAAAGRPVTRLRGDSGIRRFAASFAR